MNVEFFNNCSQTVVLTVNDKEICINSNCYATVQTPMSQIFRFSLEAESESRYNKGFYYLNVKSTYIFDGNPENTIFIITRQKDKVIGNGVCYERFFAYANEEECCLESCEVLGKESILKKYNKVNLLESLFWNPFILFITSIPKLLLVIIVLVWVWGWKAVPIFLVIAYIFVLISDLLGIKIFNSILKKGFKLDDDKTEFYAFLNSDFIKNYYTDLNKRQLMSKIENDKLF